MTVIAAFAVLTAIRRLFKVHPQPVPDHDAMVRAKAALVCMVHMQSLLQAVDDELARRQQQKATRA